MKNKIIVLSVFLIVASNLIGCGDRASSSSSSSPTKGLNSDSKERYNNLSPQGKAEFDKAMKNYDNGKR